MADVGLISRKDLSEALMVSSETGLPLGRVLTMSGWLREDQVQGAVKCQSFLKDKLIDLEQARKALALVTKNEISLEDALKKIGHVSTDTREPTKLGDLLVGSRYISEEALQEALAKSNATGLPFGRLLVLSGVISESLLTSALNAQILIRDGKITKEQAIDALQSATGRHKPIETTLAEKGFYQIPSRHSGRLGELLVLGGLISENELMNAVEMGLVNQRLLGQVLTDLGMVTQGVLDAALTVQSLVGENKMKLSDVGPVLSTMKETGKSLEEAMASLKAKSFVPEKPITMTHFLKLVGSINDDDIQKAIEVGQQNADIMGRMLMLAGILDEQTLHAARRCSTLVQQKVMSLEHACIAFDFSQRRGVTIDDALRELSWSQVSATELHKQTESQQGRAVPISVGQWEQMKFQAQVAMQSGDLQAAEQKWKRLLEVSEKLGTNDPRWAEAIEGLADIYCQQNTYSQARLLYERAMEEKIRSLGRNHVNVAATVNNLAKVHYFMRNFTDAERCARQYIEIYATVHGSSHPGVACGLENLATLYHIQKKYEQADKCYTDALTICRQELGGDHPATIRILRNYANLLRQTERVAEADRLDRFARGLISGSWKALNVPPGQELLAGDE